jgi:hypothetical protein
LFFNRRLNLRRLRRRHHEPISFAFDLWNWKKKIYIYNFKLFFWEKVNWSNCGNLYWGWAWGIQWLNFWRYPRPIGYRFDISQWQTQIWSLTPTLPLSLFGLGYPIPSLPLNCTGKLAKTANNDWGSGGRISWDRNSFFHEIEFMRSNFFSLFMRSKFLIIIRSPDHSIFHEIEIP